MIDTLCKKVAKLFFGGTWKLIKTGVNKYFNIRSNIFELIGAVVLITLFLVLVAAAVGGLIFCALAWPLIFPILINWIFGTHITIGWVTWIICVILVNVFKVLTGRVIIHIILNSQSGSVKNIKWPLK